MDIFEKLKTDLKNTPTENCVNYNWLWHSSVTEEETRRQIEEMQQVGIKSICILPLPKEFRPNYMNTHMSPDYLSDAFFEQVAFAVKTAKEKGMVVWLYDEGGWPSGSACRQIHQVRKGMMPRYIAKKTMLLKRGDALTAPDGEEFLGAFISNTHNKVQLGDVYEEDLSIDLYVSEQETNDYAADRANPVSTDTFLALTHERYKKYVGDDFGTVIPLIFNDESGVSYRAWSSHYKDEFQALYGYDMLDYLPQITETVPCETEDEWQAVRDYHNYVSGLFRKHYLQRIRAWARANHIRFAGHLNGDNNTQVFVRYGAAGSNPLAQLRDFDIPGIDIILQQVWMDKNGARENTVGFFPRYASSAAIQNGNRDSLVEEIAVYGDGITYEDTRRLTNLMAVRGINIFNLMALPYGTEGCKSIYFRPQFCSLKPDFYNLNRLNEVLDRIAYVASLIVRGKAGVKENRTALYLPISDLQCTGEISDRAAAIFEKLGQELEERQIDFDIIDDEFIREAKVIDGVLVGEFVNYATVIMGDYTSVPENTEKVVKSLKNPTPTPVIHCQNANLLAKKADIDGGTLFLIVNGGREDFAGDITIENTQNCYLCDMGTGEILSVDRTIADNNTVLSVSIPAGRECVLLFSDEIDHKEIVSSKANISKEITLTKCESRVVRRSIIASNSVKSVSYDLPWEEATLGEWRHQNGKAYAEPDFSGEVAYRFTLSTENMEEDSVCLLSLGKVEHSARVYVDGELCGIHGFPGDRIPLPVSGKKQLNIEVVVANNLANAIVNTDCYALFKREDLGPYHERALEFEKDACGGGLIGPVMALFMKV